MNQTGFFSSLRENWHKKLYSCEDLHYTPPQLLWSVFLILLGFFSYTLAMAFIPIIMPLKLDALGANSKTIVFIMSSIGQVFNITICPMASFQSDRFRSKRWGRRIPFILFTMPMLCAAWVLFAFVDLEASFLSNFLQKWVSIAPASMAVILIAIVMVLYQFFLMYVGSVIYYIYNDTIPAQFHARIVGAINVVSQLASVCFNYFFLKRGLTHFTPLLLLITAIYVIGVGAMCLFLKEPRFPPVETEAKKKSAGFITFAKESFTDRFYIYTYLSVAFFAISGTMGIFNLFYQQEIGLSLEMIGNLGALSGVFSTAWGLIVVAIGTVFVDRWHPVRVYVIMYIFIFIATIGGTRWLFFTVPGDVLWKFSFISGLGGMFLSTFHNVSRMPMLMRIFPKSRFGQLCGAQAMLRSLTVLFFSFLAGVLMDFLKVTCNLGNYAYRTNTLWILFWQFFALLFLILMYREWQKLGGFTSYKAPAPWSEKKYEQMEVTKVQNSSPALLKKVLYMFDFIFLGHVALCVAFFFYAKTQDMAESSREFLIIALPISLLITAFWFAIRMRIMKDLQNLKNKLKIKNALPHHGIMFMVACSHILMSAGRFFLTYAVLKKEHGTLSPRIWSYDMIFLALLVTAIFIYTKIEKNENPEIITDAGIANQTE